MTANPAMWNEDQVRAVLTYEDLIPAIRQALRDLSAGSAVQPVRSVMPVTASNGWFAVMPAVYGTVMGAKLVTFFPDNVGLGKHTHFAVIQLLRSDTGELMAVMDGRLITEMRTAAASAVAVDLLADGDVCRLAILGSGVQARSHFSALSLVRKFKDVRVWSRSATNAARFAHEVGARAFETAQQAVSGAQVVVTVTSSPTPILQGAWLLPDAVVCAVGAVTPERRELDADAMRGPVVVESREAASREPGDILLAGATITAEIGELLNGGSFEQNGLPVIFKSVGIAIEDIAAAKLVYEHLAG